MTQSTTQIQSVKAEVKNEVDDKSLSQEVDFDFEIWKMAGKSFKGNRELNALWYCSIFEGFENALYNFLSVPIESDTQVEDGTSELLNGIENILEHSESNIERDITPLVNCKNKIEQFVNENKDELTIVLMNNGESSRIECYNQYTERYNITFNLSCDNLSNTDEAALREHRNELYEEFVDYYNRPKRSEKRKLFMSFNRCDNGIEFSTDVTVSDVPHDSIWSKIMSYIRA